MREFPIGSLLAFAGQVVAFFFFLGFFAPLGLGHYWAAAFFSLVVTVSASAVYCLFSNSWEGEKDLVLMGLFIGIICPGILVLIARNEDGVGPLRNWEEFIGLVSTLALPAFTFFGVAVFAPLPVHAALGIGLFIGLIQYAGVAFYEYRDERRIA